eukprot:CAMPEP_0196585340 /NCGR_PEP_ID=MMETSP1081-20130531/50311_1 /TAXON_ID=36882 /ORGANISM="Pyramimonas amylifera, Strain CCMP720" /LENGTH=72 /DNA_ID=CAMNT_0041906855 /DNA_START=329 /DNA_END=547 /DNA_ORIENTATION=-
MTEEQFADEIKVSIANGEELGQDWDIWMKRTDYASFTQTMHDKHRAMKTLGGDEQVCFDDDDEDEDETAAPV